MNKRTPTPKGSEVSAAVSSTSTSAVQTPKSRDSRVASLLKLIDLCGEAKDIADGINSNFLAYLLAMAIQEARTEIRNASH